MVGLMRIVVGALLPVVLHELLPLVDAAKKSINDKTFNKSIAATRTELRGDVLGDQQRRMVVLDLLGDEAH